jgi:hypothetical protein
MQRIVRTVGQVAGYAGIILCLLTTTFRIIGKYFFLGAETGTLFEAGVALMVFACWARLQEKATEP